jgi:hypothetical protein
MCCEGRAVREHDQSGAESGGGDALSSEWSPLSRSDRLLLDCRERIGQILDARLRSKVSARDVRQNVRDFLTTSAGVKNAMATTKITPKI